MFPLLAMARSCGLRAARGMAMMAASLHHGCGGVATRARGTTGPHAC
ncbi:hypothetical protein [Komagataeibacter xylinus]|nr:hypothetical protein [Komagataeibacter xylinus]